MHVGRLAGGHAADSVARKIARLAVQKEGKGIVAVCAQGAAADDRVARQDQHRRVCPASA